MTINWRTCLRCGRKFNPEYCRIYNPEYREDEVSKVYCLACNSEMDECSPILSEGFER